MSYGEKKNFFIYFTLKKKNSSQLRKKGCFFSYFCLVLTVCRTIGAIFFFNIYSIIVKTDKLHDSLNLKKFFIICSESTAYDN